MLVLPGYRTTRLLYESVNSRVWAGARAADGRAVIIKELAETQPKPDLVARMRREHQLLRELDLPGVPRPLELAVLGYRPVLVVESIGGQSLAQLLVARSFPLRDLLDMAARLARVLAGVHRRGVVHKDVSPGNVVWGPESGEVQLIDFGISSHLRQEEADPVQPHVIRGTLAFISPEQSGRMNRSVDARSDLYSLGATLFSVFAGRPPFAATDAVELVHCHLAVPAPRLCEIRPELPGQVGAIVDRLLAKNAEDRYPNAGSLAADLEQCLAEFGPDGTIPPFPLGLREQAGQFHLPEKLYGREAQVERLLAAFDRVAEGGRELVLVAGYSGIGKTRLVREVHKPITGRRGFFAAGKYDQYRRNLPYSAVVEAFAQLVGQILTLPDAELARWKQRLGEALGANGRLVVDVIPAVEHIVGPQPPVPPLGMIEARNRFHHVFDRFARAFADAAHPVALFLDDLQWADAPSLQLLERLLTDPESRHLLVIGAYRDNEVDPLHPLNVKLDELCEAGAAVSEIELLPLQRADVAALLADALRTRPEAVAELAAVCGEKTEGNPFFLTRLLLDLVGEGAISWGAAADRWTWDLGAIRAMRVESGAVDLLLKRLGKLPAPTRHVLRLAACIGARFDLSTLAVVSERDPLAVARALWPAVEQGLVVPLGASWTLLEHAVDPAVAAGEVAWRFLHDRVQQAAYALVPPGERPDLHLQVGRLMQSHLGEAERVERIFEIVGHLHAARERITDPAERAALARLEHRAGDRARSSAAYEPALAFYRQGLDLLGHTAWSAEPALALALHLGAAEAAFSSADFASMDAHLDAVLSRAADPLDKIRAWQVRISSLVNRNGLAEAIDTAIEVLPLLGVRLPRHASPEQAGEWLARARAAMGARSIPDLAELPVMTDRSKLAAMGLLNSIASATYVGAPELFPLVCFEQIALTAEHGVTPHSAMAMTTFGIMLGGMLGDLEACYACSGAAARILDRLRAEEVEGRTRYVAAAYLRVWKEPVLRVWEATPEIHSRCLDTGDPEFAAWAAMIRVLYGFFLGRPLPEAEPDAARWVSVIRRLKQDPALAYASMAWQCMRNLAGLDGDFWELRGQGYDFEARMPVHLEQGDRAAVCTAHLCRLVLRTLAGRVEEAAESADALRADQGTLISLFHVPVFLTFDAVIAASRIRAGADPQALGARIADARARIELFARHAPANHAHRLRWIDAEVAASAGRPGEAAPAYEEAMLLAREHGWLLDEGAIAERAADFHAARGTATAARAYAVEARYAWERLGARALVQALLRRWPEADRRREPTDPRATRSFTSTTDRFDLRSVLKVSQAISEEIRLDRLKSHLARAVLENAGAQRAILLLGRAEPRIGAVASVNDDTDEGLPWGVVNFVLRTGEAVVLAEARSDPRFADDPWLKHSAARSVLCAPILQRGAPIGAFYLEHRIVPGLFTRDLIETLGVLCAQAAISIENATLYESLEEKVRERTQELEVRNRFIRRTFGRYLSDEVVDTLLDDETALELGGEPRTVTVLMADLRGFTSLCGRLAPRQVVQAVNTWLSGMTEVVVRGHGTIDEFLGDAMLVIFGAPVSRPDDARRAVLCAVEMQIAMAEVNRRLAGMDLPSVEMGIGVSTGEVVVGNIGSEKRAKYGVVGPAVNLSARIESFTTGGQVLISESTLRAAGEGVRVDDELRIDAKGFDEPVRVLQVSGIGENDVPVLDLALRPLGAGRAIEVAEMHGKHGLGNWWPARLLALGDRAAEIATEWRPAPRTELRLRIDGCPAVYGMVARVLDRGGLLVRLTSGSGELRSAVEGWK